VLELCTDEARRMVLAAEEEARLLQHDYVGTEHLLIAATEADPGLTTALAALGLTTEVVRGTVTRMVAPAGTERSGDLPMTAEAKATMERSLREALQLGHGAIRPEHLVLGLLDVHDGTMPVLLARLNVRAEAIRVAVLVLFDTATAEVAPATVAPVCPRCGEPVAGRLRIAHLAVEGQPVRAAYCAGCGAIVPVAFLA